MGEDFLFGGGTPAESADLAVAADDAVTGDEEGEAVGTDGRTDSAGGFGRVYGLCNFLVGCGGAVWNASEGLPDAELERCAGGERADG